MELDYKAIGKRVKIARIKADLTQEKLSELVGVSPTHLSSEEYCSLYDRISDLKAKHPFIEQIMEGSGELSLSAEEHKIVTEFFSLQFNLESMERQHI